MRGFFGEETYNCNVKQLFADPSPYGLFIRIKDKDGEPITGQRLLPLNVNSDEFTTTETMFANAWLRGQANVELYTTFLVVRRPVVSVRLHE
jgi:hypothetical protein